jgi:heme exporter protein D
METWVRVAVSAGMVVLAVAVAASMARLAGLTRRLDKLERETRTRAPGPGEPPISGNSK